MVTLQVEVMLKGVDVEVDVDFNPGWFKAGNRWGHPDNWEPDEGECAEIEAITLHLNSGRYVDVTKHLAASEIQKIQDRCDRYQADPCDDYDDHHDDYDDSRSYNVDCSTDRNGLDLEYKKYRSERE